MKTNTTPRITWQQYKAAADRIRRGQGRLGDEAICNAFDAQELPQAARARDWWELPVAQRCWESDTRAVERR